MESQCVRGRSHSLPSEPVAGRSPVGGAALLGMEPCWEGSLVHGKQRGRPLLEIYGLFPCDRLTSQATLPPPYRGCSGAWPGKQQLCLAAGLGTWMEPSFLLAWPCWPCFPSASEAAWPLRTGAGRLWSMWSGSGLHTPLPACFCLHPPGSEPLFLLSSFLSGFSSPSLRVPGPYLRCVTDLGVTDLPLFPGAKEVQLSDLQAVSKS